MQASRRPPAGVHAADVDPHVAQRYLLKRRLGKGAYGIVWKAVDRRTGETVAIKKIFDAFRDKTDAQRTFREIMLLQEFGDHPNIIRLLDVIRAENDRDIYLVFESMDKKKKWDRPICSLQDHWVHADPPLTDLHAPSDTDLNAVIGKGRLLKDIHKRYIFYQLLRATKFIHSGRVIHRDQKPSNVLLDASCLVKLCDFGLARPLAGLPEGPEGQALTEYVATRWYRAPEVLLSSSWPRQTLEALLPADTPPEALDLLKRLLVFAPDQRLSAAQALRHPYVRRFHCPAREWTLETDVRLPVHEGVQLTAPEYRNRLYQMILERVGSNRNRREKGPGEAPPGAEPRAPLPQACATKPRAAPLLPPGWPEQDLGHRPQNSPGHDPAPDPRGGAKNIPRQNSAHLLQRPPPGGRGRGERPLGTTAESPSAPPWGKPRVQGAVPSLTSQAAAQVAIQALIRNDRDPGRGVRAAGARRAPPSRPGEARLEPRPGRRMFSASASQGIQGAARAALGGYSQAYGTVCHSALGSLPLLPGPHV
uniref:mitogen-activated protein kinase n=1 Tax=Molossus molossus TaxID=27622 RepID=A0A7J8BAW0_MOLMO|nr:mitogen-activated protein kinase 15 [Molossus molossus]